MTRPPFIIHRSSFIVCLTLGLATVADIAPAQTPDTVVLAPRADDPGRIVATGRIVDYTGELLTLEGGGGVQQKIPGKQVVEVRSTWSADHLAGDELWRRRDYAAATRKYQAAYDAEPRRWAKRLIQSRVIASLREQDQWEAAAAQFLLLVRDDPTTPYFGVVPLPWTVIFPSPSLENKARQWAADRTSNVAALLGASFLLSSTAKAEGLKRLNELTLDKDIRIALLAEAQLWRMGAVTADAAAIEGWERTVEKLPEPLRAGPLFAVGKAWTLRDNSERAALVLLRIPILYPDEHRLAAEALWSAGQMLERLAQTREAAGLYRELVREYPRAAAAATAEQRLAELKDMLE